MTNGRLTWSEKNEECLRRMNEHLGGIFPTKFTLAGEQDVAYYDPSFVEQMLYEMSVMKLREVPLEELRQLGSSALSTIAYSSGDTVNLTAMKAFPTARIDGFPCIRVRPAAFIQQDDAAYPASGPLLYTFYDGKVWFNGTTLVLTVIVEPNIASFQADEKILPGAYDSEVIDLTCAVLTAMDYLPEGRL